MRPSPQVVGSAGASPPSEAPEPERLSGRAYSRRRGCTHYSVQKAIRDGRIKDAVDADGMIDPELADRLWAESTDPSKPLNTVSGDPKLGRGNGAPLHDAFHRERGVREGWAAKRERLDYLEAKGKLRDFYTEKVSAVLFDVLRMLRDQLGGAADRLQQDLGPVVGERVRGEHAEVLQAAADAAKAKSEELAGRLTPRRTANGQ